MGAYPDGCTQAMHDRAHGSEDREPCQECNGTGNGDDPTGDGWHVTCPECGGAGFEQRIQAHERDFDPSEDTDVEF